MCIQQKQKKQQMENYSQQLYINEAIPYGESEKPQIRTSISMFDEPRPKFPPFDAYQSSISDLNQISEPDLNEGNIFDGLEHQQRQAKEKEQTNKNSCRRENPIPENSLQFLLLRQCKFTKRNNNTVRFLIDLAVEHLPRLKSQLTADSASRIANMCQRLRQWHLEDKKNVYNFDHLKMFFGHHEPEAVQRGIRQAFNLILRTQTLNNMKKPKSQIKDKVHYLRVAKLFSLRCKNAHLCLRNQSR